MGCCSLQDLLELVHNDQLVIAAMRVTLERFSCFFKLAEVA